MENEKALLEGVKYRKNCGRCNGTGWAKIDPIDLEQGRDDTGDFPCDCWKDIKQDIHLGNGD